MSSKTRSALTAPVNKIIPISTVDGPGARTSIFLQGCNIACLYCHNPETQRLCIHCGICVPHCPSQALRIENKTVTWDIKRCTQCDTCVAVCPHFASPKVKHMSPEEVMQLIQPNMPFIRGITVSGGECTLYPEFLTGLFTLAKTQGLHCLIDSNGMVDLSQYPDLISVLDGVMLDIKAWDPETFSALTGADENTVMKKNLSYLANQNRIEELRIVYLPNYVDASNILHGVSEILGDCIQHTELKLIAFRNVGVKGVLSDTETPSAEEMQQLFDFAKSIGFRQISMR